MYTPLSHYSFFFFFNDTATTEIYTLSLHDALPISPQRPCHHRAWRGTPPDRRRHRFRRANVRSRRAAASGPDRKSTRLNSSHGYISYAVFCLKKKKKQFCTVIKNVIHDRTHSTTSG